MKILVINCGSSSLKYQLIDVSQSNTITKGAVERIGLKDPIFKYSVADKEYIISKAEQNDHTDEITDHKSAVKLVLHTLTTSTTKIIEDISEIAAVGHRVVHGGEKYSSSIIINDEVIKNLKELSSLAPLHNPANITGIEVCQKLMPNTPMVAVFDTAFHQTLPDKAYIYALPYELYKTYKIRRYGFHGTSHKYVANTAAKALGKSLHELKLITCHLGNGSSICAIKNGNSIDTSMGFTPLAGLPMGTRSGDIDPSILTFLASEANLSLSGIDELLNKKSGVLGISGISSDFREIDKEAEKGNQQAKLALDVFIYSIIKYIGAYTAAMNGVDAIIFTAGIGENNKIIRAKILESISFMGIELDKEQNEIQAEIAIITTANSKVKAMIIPTNEELMIAIETNELANK